MARLRFVRQPVGMSRSGEEYRNIDYFNPVDNDEVPVAHFGACLSSEAF